MNIALFTPNQNPYSETFIQAHKKYLKGNVFYFYGRKGNIHLEFDSDFKPRFKTLFLKLVQKLLKKPSYFTDAHLIQRAFKSNKIDVILVEYGTHAHQLLPVLKKLKVPFVVHFHGYDASVKEVIEKHGNYKEVFALASKIIVVSKVMTDKLILLGCPKEKLIYNVYGPQPEFHKVATAFSNKQFIAIGRFTDKKAPYYTILAFATALKKHPDAQLIIAGQGVLFNMCINLVKYLNIEDKVMFPGIVTPEQYRSYLKESRAFIQHSITAENGNMEGTPLAVLEASAAGLPVISTKHAGIPDVIVDGRTGLLCAEHDVAAMAHHMDMLLSDVEKAKRMGAAGKEHIKQHFSLERHIKALQKTLEESTKP